VCELLDQDEPGRPYATTLAAQRASVEDPGLTPSARILEDMRRHGESFFRFAKRLSEAHRDCFLAKPLPAGTAARMAAEARASLEEQATIEASDKLSFEQYLDRYFSQS
jgi:glutamate--cysteine ligase